MSLQVSDTYDSNKLLNLWVYIFKEIFYHNPEGRTYAKLIEPVGKLKEANALMNSELTYIKMNSGSGAFRVNYTAPETETNQFDNLFIKGYKHKRLFDPTNLYKRFSVAKLQDDTGQLCISNTRIFNEIIINYLIKKIKETDSDFDDADKNNIHTYEFMCTPDNDTIYIAQPTIGYNALIADGKTITTLKDLLAAFYIKIKDAINKPHSNDPNNDPNINSNDIQLISKALCEALTPYLKTLQKLRKKYKFVHTDLHFGNIFIKSKLPLNQNAGSTQSMPIHTQIITDLNECVLLIADYDLARLTVKPSILNTKLPKKNPAISEIDFKSIFIDGKAIEDRAIGINVVPKEQKKLQKKETVIRTRCAYENYETIYKDSITDDTKIADMFIYSNWDILSIFINVIAFLKKCEYKIYNDPTTRETIKQTVYDPIIKLFQNYVVNPYSNIKININPLKKNTITVYCNLLMDFFYMCVEHIYRDKTLKNWIAFLFEGKFSFITRVFELFKSNYTAGNKSLFKNLIDGAKIDINNAIQKVKHDIHIVTNKQYKDPIYQNILGNLPTSHIESHTNVQSSKQGNTGHNKKLLTQKYVVNKKYKHNNPIVLQSESKHNNPIVLQSESNVKNPIVPQSESNVKNPKLAGPMIELFKTIISILIYMYDLQECNSDEIPVYMVMGDFTKKFKSYASTDLSTIFNVNRQNLPGSVIPKFIKSSNAEFIKLHNFMFNKNIITALLNTLNSIATSMNDYFNIKAAVKNVILNQKLTAEFMRLITDKIAITDTAPGNNPTKSKDILLNKDKITVNINIIPDVITNLYGIYNYIYFIIPEFFKTFGEPIDMLNAQNVLRLNITLNEIFKFICPQTNNSTSQCILSTELKQYLSLIVNVKQNIYHGTAYNFIKLNSECKNIYLRDKCDYYELTNKQENSYKDIVVKDGKITYHLKDDAQLKKLFEKLKPFNIYINFLTVFHTLFMVDETKKNIDLCETYINIMDIIKTPKNKHIKTVKTVNIEKYKNLLTIILNLCKFLIDKLNQNAKYMSQYTLYNDKKNAMTTNTSSIDLFIKIMDFAFQTYKQNIEQNNTVIVTDSDVKTHILQVDIVSQEPIYNTIKNKNTKNKSAVASLSSLPTKKKGFFSWFKSKKNNKIPQHTTEKITENQSKKIRLQPAKSIIPTQLRTNENKTREYASLMFPGNTSPESPTPTPISNPTQYTVIKHDTVNPIESPYAEIGTPTPNESPYAEIGTPTPNQSQNVAQNNIANLYAQLAQIKTKKKEQQQQKSTKPTTFVSEEPTTSNIPNIPPTELPDNASNPILSTTSNKNLSIINPVISKESKVLTNNSNSGQKSYSASISRQRNKNNSSTKLQTVSELRQKFLDTNIKSNKRPSTTGLTPQKGKLNSRIRKFESLQKPQQNKNLRQPTKVRA